MGAHTDYRNVFYKDYEALFQKNEYLAGELRAMKYNYGLALKQLQTLQKREQEALRDNAVLSSRAEALEKEGARLNGLLNLDGANSGIPTSMTSLNKKKVIPNSRVKTGNKIGGQGGHAKHKLETFRDEEVNVQAEHPLEHCPQCQWGSLEDTGERIEKDEVDYKVTVERIRHVFKVYRCPCCGKAFHAEIPVELKEENPYGPQVQALALTLMNQGNVTINKAAAMTDGFTDGELRPSEGYLCKVQKRAAPKASATNCGARSSSRTSCIGPTR